ncbi:FimV/HubP family polar landmark protein [Vibrio sp. 10N]|uniref:FimV/HubP family polar landmark protein n=1 Tax=Vibrio sp. 10N TaxID=3058938 RepID=UPI002812E472|nr:FimV/HubP family polar landmark protein [Vibrio sp. 10N]
MHQILKPLLVTLALAGATTSLSISADTIRLTGPNGEVISAPQYSQPVRQLANDESSAPSRYYGPTAQNETLWSIASRFKPAGASVQQTIYAFYELNPGQFEKGNIHQLLPGSELRIPSNALINRVDLQEALAVLAAHQNKLNQPSPVVEAPPRPEPKKPQPKPTEVVTAPPVAKAEPTPAVETSPQPSTPEVSAPKIQAPDVTEALREELSRSESELLSLEERNHQLRLMLSEVQHEVEALKTEVDNEERIRTEVERQLSEEKRKQVEMARLAPSQLDVWLAKPWFVALLAFVPALLLGLLVMALLRSRKRRNDEPAKQQLTDSQTETTDKSDMAAAAAGGGAAMAAAAVASEEDDLFSDDLLAGLDDETEQSDNEESDANDVFADLDEADFDFNLDDEDDPFASIDDDGELDIGVVDLDTSNNGISVKDGEKALGLEEMERALNDVAVPGDDEELDLNLSDDDTDSSNDVVSQDDLDSLFADFSLDTQGAAEENVAEGGLDEDSALNQAQMDELLAGDDFDLDEGEIDLDDLSADSPLASLEKLIAEEEVNNAQESDDATTSFDTSLESAVSDSTVSDNVDNDDIDDLFAQFSQIDAEAENSIKPDTESDDVELLDEMLTDDFELSELDDSDLTLDEMLSAEPPAAGDDDEVQLLADEETELDENSTELLDEVLFESSLSSSSDEPSEDDFDLDPFSADNLLGSEISDDEMDALFAANAPEQTALESSPEDTNHEELADTPMQDVSLEGAAEVGTSTLAELDNEDVISSEHTDLDDELLSGDELRLDDEPNLDDELQVDDAFDLSDETDIAPDVQTDEVAAAVSDAELDVQQPELEASEALDTELEPLISDALDPELPAFEDHIPSEFNIEPESLASAQEDEMFDAQVAAGLEAATEPHTVDPQAEKSAESDIASNSEFEFVPEIEGGSQLSHEGDDSEQARKELDALVANEFGVPSDDDWLVDEPVADDAGPSSLDTLVETPDDEEDAEFLANALQSEYGEEQAFADAEGDNDDQPMSEDSSDSELTFDDAELPEYSEEHAFADANLTQENVQPELTAEPASKLTSEETEHDLTFDSVTEPGANGTEETNDSHASADESAEPASLEAPDAPLEDFEFPEFTEQDALLDLDESDVEPSSESMEPAVHSAEFEEALSLESLPEYDEQQAAMDLAPMQEPVAATSEMIGETLDHSEIDALADAFSMVDMSAIEQEGNLDELLQDSDGATFSNISPVDQTTADSAGLDIDAMLQETSNSDAGEDWNGFTLTDEQRAAINNDIPDEEQAIWSGEDVGSLANASDEDWSSQDPVADFDGQEKSFMTIDELMAQVDDGDAADQEEEELKLDVGLDEFPDVIGPISEVDVDCDSEAAGNLDMAKIYIEMNDYQGAVKLLEKVLLEGSGQIEQEARQLLSKLSEHQ